MNIISQKIFVKQPVEWNPIALSHPRKNYQS